MPEREKSLVRVARAGRRFRRRLAVVSDEAGFLAARRPVSMLLVEGSDEAGMSLAGRLGEVAGYDLEIIRATGLAEARARAAERRFDVYFCDFWLADETVLPLLDDLRAGPARPVVLLSHTEADDIDLIGRRAGAAGVVQKADLAPSDIESVLDTVLGPTEDAGTKPARPLDDWLMALLAMLQKVERSSAEAAADDPEMTALIAEVASEASDLKAGVVAALYDLKNRPALPAPAIRFDLVPHLLDAAARLRARGGASLAFVAPQLPLVVECRPETVCDCLHGLVAEGLAMLDAGRRVALRPSIVDGAVEIRLVAGPAAGPVGAGPHETLHAAVVRARRQLSSAVATSAGGVFEVRQGRRSSMARLVLPLRPRARRG